MKCKMNLIFSCGCAAMLLLSQSQQFTSTSRSIVAQPQSMQSMQYVSAALADDEDDDDDEDDVAAPTPKASGRAAAAPASSSNASPAKVTIKMDDDDDDGVDTGDDDEDDADESDEPTVEQVRASVLASKELHYDWADSERLTHMWQLISNGDLYSLRALIMRDPPVLHSRSGDGRGPLWWAYEYNKQDIVRMLVEFGADEEAADASGNKPGDMSTGKVRLTGDKKKKKNPVLAYAPPQPGQQSDGIERIVIKTPKQKRWTPQPGQMGQPNFHMWKDCRSCTSQGFGWCPIQRVCGGFVNQQCGRTPNDYSVGFEPLSGRY